MTQQHWLACRSRVRRHTAPDTHAPPHAPQAAIIARPAAPMTQPPGDQSPAACASPAAFTAVPRTPRQHSKHTSKPPSTSNTRVVSQWACPASTYHTQDHTRVAAQRVHPASAYDTHLLRPYVTQPGGPACLPARHTPTARTPAQKLSPVYPCIPPRSAPVARCTYMVLCKSEGWVCAGTPQKR